MSCAVFRFYAELNDFLPPEKRQVSFRHSFQGRVSIKDMIEALGVPHTEVDLILVNGESVGFDYWVKDADVISVYPVFESLDITPLLCVRSAPLRETRFVVDTHLGRLAAYLRMLGFDTLYGNDTKDEELAMLSSRQKRILLTRDRGLLKRSLVTHGYYIRETSPRRQLVEVARRFDLPSSIQPFRRCIRCNHLLQSVSKETVAKCLPPSTGANHQEFQRCTSCGRVYWKGSHYERMQEFIGRIQSENGA